MNRNGELGHVPMRTDRFFAINNSWYFDTREGSAIGPYDSKLDARKGLADFIEFLMLGPKYGIQTHT